ncbi:dienelactone hydrolase family protein [Synechococcus sp. HB1133]|uniref:dienelactone hydrolase family protein n=1 Tax=unclassified Synechococcus TaxID=2626047 RepID=UPI00140DC303|nr:MULTISPECIES: dienelactone hydrolase family protein [unclassified Synechococcus]MCB4421436.1 dienelactone hydrolase family protein [Synechococcus sp. HB1133]MCB4431213.1 dienelactone hydrolase family protein [Synechococcus sp. HBA1120]NHI80378.1 dienelactone hydrolase family protein [Synechococcus sp. HB1133]
MRPPYGANPVVTIPCVSCEPVTISNSLSSRWVQLTNGDVPLRCWWAEPQQGANDIEPKSLINRVYIVLPEVFGVNAWVRSVADRLAAHGVPALAVPLFARTAPNLELAYETSDLAQGRRHKDATTSDQILGDIAAALAWLRARHPQASVHLVGFCFGGHAAFLAASLPGVAAAFDFYGAGVSRMRPGGGEPSLALLPQIQARLTCVFGTADPLIPAQDRETIASALRKADPAGERLRCLSYDGADHGFMCEARSSFDPQASAQGWRLLLEGL